jgi:hypothetical protein
MQKLDILRKINFGQRVAEEEIDELSKYFVETNQWRRIFAGDIDIVYGPKGSGKSAIYSLLDAKKDDLLSRKIIAIPAENPRGTPIFENLVSNPPKDESEFISLWKLYFLSLVGSTLQESFSSNKVARKVIRELEKADLLKRERSLRSLLISIVTYLKQIRSVDVGTYEMNEDTGGLTGGSIAKITLREPSREKAKLGYVSIDSLINNANVALSESGYSIWILLDRLDIAFAEAEELEENALRALFRVYRDFTAMNKIQLKIFLRTDIWKKITQKGFREASHITRDTTIEWDEDSLLNLVARRILQSNTIRNYYKANSERILQSMSEQKELFYRIFPDQIDVGSNNPKSFRWMINHIKDGSDYAAPRELIHLLNAAQEIQIQRLERGEAEPEDERLFLRTVVQDALPKVSNTRLHQTIYAEYRSVQEYLEKLREEKTQQYPRTLAKIWGTSESNAKIIADELVEIGFFARRGGKNNPSYWVPFLYRDALNMVQGTADV